MSAVISESVYCPHCQSADVKIRHVSMLSPDGKGHHKAATMENATRVVARDKKYKVAATGQMVVTEFTCSKGHRWGYSFREMNGKVQLVASITKEKEAALNDAIDGVSEAMDAVFETMEGVFAKVSKVLKKL
jgi:hypothetical protein